MLVLLGPVLLVTACPRPRIPGPQLAGRSMVETRLFFGLTRPGGAIVPQAEWRVFLADVVTPRFPQGLTVLDAYGQYADPTTRQTRAEPARVVILLHDGGAAAERALAEIIDQYRGRFEQQSVLRVDTRAGVSF